MTRIQVLIHKANELHCAIFLSLKKSDEVITVPVAQFYNIYEMLLKIIKMCQRAETLAGILIFQCGKEIYVHIQ